MYWCLPGRIGWLTSCGTLIEDETHEYHEAFAEHFRQIDEVIGEIAQDLDKGDSLLMLSDHGFERLEKNVYVNYLLRKEGFLAFEDGATPSLKTIRGDTRAFALDPGRIYVNLRGRYPRGCVEAGDRRTTLGDLEDIFTSLEIEGKKVIKRVYRGEELYEGPQAHRAPDLVLLGNKGYNLRGNVKATQLYGTDIFAGKHSQADAFLLVCGEGADDIVPEKPCVSDVVGIMDKLQGRNSL